ncbi:MAG: acetyl-CoA carboxylase biotin carboxyl carrier protein [Candidatus Omnitrophica bacterium]|nr:acetyl-CoA carboxylase biotin carboxyl carrier protein [Candidatus Omnitrophota bacterium]
MDLEHLNEYIEFMNTNNLCELEIEEEGKRIKLRKNSLNQSVMLPQMSTPMQTPTMPPLKEGTSGLIEIKSPMVGTFYTAPSPGAKSYVEIGDTIKPGDVLCIIEAMKLMNEIKAEVGGKVVQIPVENSDAVEFGQPIFLIEPN